MTSQSLTAEGHVSRQNFVNLTAEPLGVALDLVTKVSPKAHLGVLHHDLKPNRLADVLTG